MDLIGRYGNEYHPVYQRLQAQNYTRYVSFLDSMVESAIASDQQLLSEELIKAINFHAIAGLHPEAGQYRSEPVWAGSLTPPPHGEVPNLMANAVEVINQNWNTQPSIILASAALWRINYVHPFINGNGRTARASCYFIICVKAGGLVPGADVLLNQLGQQPVRDDYVEALRLADNGDFSALHILIARLITQQLQ